MLVDDVPTRVKGLRNIDDMQLRQEQIWCAVSSAMHI